SVWSRLGAEVTVVEIVDRILPGMDGGMAGQLQRALERQGLSFRLATEARGAVRAGNGVRVTVASKDGSADVEADVVLVAIGRRPHMNGLGVRELGVKVDERGRIVVNDRFETSVAGVFAIGDVIAGPMLAPRTSRAPSTATRRCPRRSRKLRSPSASGQYIFDPTRDFVSGRAGSRDWAPLLHADGVPRPAEPARQTFRKCERLT